MKSEDIAKVCHEVNKAYCESLGDHSQPAWEEAPSWQKASALQGVSLHLNNPEAGPEASHDSWFCHKVADGWSYGAVKDVEKKEHPCMVPFEQLPKEQQIKDFLFRAVVHACKALCLAAVLVGCSSGLQETAFRDESGTYIVSRSLVNDRVTANQAHVVGVFACDVKYTLEQMVELKKDGNEHSWYSTCQPIERYRPGAYQVTSDQPIGTLYQGPISAAILGASVGTGLALSGDTVSQSGGGASASARAKAGKGHRR